MKKQKTIVKKRDMRLNKEVKQTILLTIVLCLLIFLNYSNKILPSNTVNIEPNQVIIEDNKIKLNSLTLKQKIAQMIITYESDYFREKHKEMFIGGIHFDAKETKEKYIEDISKYKENTTIPFFIVTDMEGCINPLANFHDSLTFKDINTKEEAYELGKNHGEILSELGFNMNFAPVVDLNDSIWKCRSFRGSPEEIAKKAKSYIDGMEEFQILSVSKHYPGKTLVSRDPHSQITYGEIEEEDIFPFMISIKNNVSGIMISHVITEGVVISNGKPAVVCPELIYNLRKNYQGLIITDEIGMQGLRKYYENHDELYFDLILAGNDIILFYDPHPNVLFRFINVIEDAVDKGFIQEKRIDESVIRILNAKNIEVI